MKKRVFSIQSRNLSRSKKAYISTITAFALQVVNIIAALVVPRIIITNFGSEANGLINSIAQFLGYISFLQMGVGGVYKAALYKPLAFGDTKQISRIVKASEEFFKKIGYISLVYVAILACSFPYFSDSTFDFIYTASMVVVIAISTVAQYVWGFTYQDLLIADQRGYIQSIIIIVSTIANTVLTIVLANFGASLHVIKLVSASVFVINPLLLRGICKRYYKIDKSVEADTAAIKQRWNGLFHSFADFVHRKTDVFMLTVLATLKDVSVYSVYAVVLNGLTAIIGIISGPFMAAMGNMLAKKEEHAVRESVRVYMFITHYVCSVVFSVAILMILPFIKLYTQGVNDANYLHGTFAVLLITAELIGCLKGPYISLVGAAGHYKQTKLGPILEAGINLILSVLLVRKYHIVGVAIGTLVGMSVGTIYFIWYTKHNIIHMDYTVSLKRYAISAVSILLITLLGKQIHISVVTAFDWVCAAVVFTIMAAIITTGMNFIFYKSDMQNTITKVLRVIGLRK